MKLNFQKYQGTGNDFMLIDDRQKLFDTTNKQLIASLCDRRFGIGADGLMLLREKEGFDFEMIYFNADGGLGSMCGNGGRCIARFAADLGVTQKTQVSFLAVDGPHEAILSETAVRLKMSDVTEIETHSDFYFLNTGSPHVVKFIAAGDAPDVEQMGRAIRYSDQFAKEGTNVNLVQETEQGVFVWTYERGVEAETFSCGTGVTAVALVCAFLGKTFADDSCAVATRGGDLRVYFKKHNQGFSDIWLEGPAKNVFAGTVDV
ncbi:MAG: diaminopimelate epimerase [Bacteroidia bacterium]